VLEEPARLRPGAAGIGFDLDHTLLIDNHLERVAFLRLLEDVILYGGSPRVSLAEEVRKVDDLLARQRAGLFSIEDAVLRFAVDRGAEASNSLVEKYKTLVLGMVESFVVPVPGVRVMLRALRERGFGTAALSNGWSPLQERKAACIGFDGPVLASSVIGFQKPDARAFAALVEALGVARSAVWYVGDDPRIDITGAAAAGLLTVWFDFEGTGYPQDAPPPTRKIASLSDLLVALQGTSAAP
jgi:HAD superfamily hydrolase (TIGR01509 family)